MRLHSWLSSLSRQFAIAPIRTSFRRRRSRLPAASAIVERLESRQLLSVAAVGFETRVNSYTQGTQVSQAVAMDAAGDYVAVWSSAGQDGASFGIYAQRYNAAGTAQGAEFKVNTYTTGDQSSPAVSMDSTGDFVVAWQSAGQDSSTTGVYAQRYNSTGTPQGVEFQVNTYTTNTQAVPAVAMDSAGDFVIAWMSNTQDGNNLGIYAQRYNAAGTAQGAEFQANTYTTGLQRFPSVATDAVGDFVISWESLAEDGDNYGIYAQRYNSTGAAQGVEFRANAYTTNSQTNSSAAMDAAGDFVIAWQSTSQDGNFLGIYAQRYNAAGAIQGSEFKVNTYTTSNQRNPAVAMDASGDFVMSWQSYNQDGSLDGIYAQRFNASGVGQGLEFRVNIQTANGQGSPCVAIDTAGDFVIAWQSAYHDGSLYGIYSQRYVTTVGPIVTALLEGAGPTVVQDGDELISSVNALSVNFSDDMNVVPAGAHSVINPANWRLTRYGSDVSYLISAITFGFDAIRNRYAAVVNFTLPLPEGSYELVARQTIQSATGQSLDGDADGIPFGDFVRDFYVASAQVTGSESPVNTFTTGAQIAPAIASDAAGDTVVAWQSNNQDGSGYGIYAQRYNSSGTAQGLEFRVNTYTTSNQTAASVAMDATGRFVITWTSFGQDGSGFGVYAQRYSAAGIAQGTEFKVNTFTTNSQSASSVAMDATGDFVITWASSAQDGSNNGVYAQRYNAAGVAQGGEFQVNTYTTNSQNNPAVAMDATGDFVIVWMSNTQDGSAYGIYERRYNANGTSPGNEFRVNTTILDNQGLPAVAMDAAGDFVIAWESYLQDGSSYGIYAQQFGAAGDLQGSEFQVNTYTTNAQQVPSVAMNGRGDFVITWESSGQDGSNFGTYAQRFNANGTPQGAESQVNTYSTGDQKSSAVAMDAAGDLTIGWASSAQDGNLDGIYSQRDRVDVAPRLDQIEAVPLSAVASLTTHVTSSLLVFDFDSSNWTGATIQITKNYQNGQDVLGFTNTAKITGTWDASTGTLTLTGSDTVLNYRTALRNVTYHNTSGSPNTAVTRTIEFQATDGLLSSNAVSRDLTVLATSAAPLLSGVNGTGTFTENAAAILIAGNLVASDADSVNLASATVSFTNWQAEDRVNFNNIFALQHTFTQDLVAHTAVLTITGTAAVEHYQTLLRSIIYWDVSDNPITTTRVASFRLNDGGLLGNIVTRNIAVTAVNDAPLLSAIESTPMICQANNLASQIPISALLLVADADSTKLSKAVVTIQGFLAGDKLTFVNQNGITGSFNAGTGVLTLSGLSVAGNYRTAIRSVTFSTSAAVGTRTLSITAADNFGTPATSLAITRDVSVVTTNLPPGLTGLSAPPLAYVRGTAAAQLATGIVTLDSDGINLTGATIKITANYQNGQDVLAVTNGSGITGVFSAATGTLTLTGIASLANYQTVLRTVTYKTNTAGANTLTRTISWTINDGLALSSPVSRNVTLT